ncbi:hypothetical protein AB5J72_40105 [Streptomyces sp. CG1]|uniref:hypothetical protein n=1 Tax=Streptomyces sp. CG1 TaxID=1287523 RepID=UPI0034E2ED44
MTLEEAYERLEAKGTSRHDLDMMISDHRFDGDPLWADLGCPPGRGFTAPSTSTRTGTGGR